MQEPDSTEIEAVEEPNQLEISRAIRHIRGQEVMLDMELAEFYGVETKRINEQVKRNPGRFPANFVFQLTAEEKVELVAICDRFPGEVEPDTRLARSLKHSSAPPVAFTEHGAIMLATVLNSERADAMAVQVVNAFVALRRNPYAAFEGRIQQLEAQVAKLSRQPIAIGPRMELEDPAVVAFVEAWARASEHSTEPWTTSGLLMLCRAEGLLVDRFAKLEGPRAASVALGMLLARIARELPTKDLPYHLKRRRSHENCSLFWLKPNEKGAG